MRRGLLAVLLLASARAFAAPGPADPDNALPAAFWAEAAAPAEAPDSFRYLIEGIEVRGNRKTEQGLILAEIGLGPGDVVTPEDPRVRAAELRLLSLGYFLRVELRLARGLHRGGAVRGAILVVEVEERGTIVLGAIHLGTSEATAFWGGLDVTETNFLGKGIALGGGFVESTRPSVPGATRGQAFALRASGPPRRGAARLALSGSALYSDGSEFYQAFGREDSPDPKLWVATNTRRIGGGLAGGADLSRTTRFSVEARFEAIRADFPGVRTRDLGDGRARAIAFNVHEGTSRLASLTSVLDIDTRSDPVLPASGHRISVSLAASLPVFGSQYSYAKGVTQGSFYRGAFGNHVVAFHGLAGAVLGDAPYFDQFFVGDLNFLLPPRALGLNFASLPSRNLLGTSVAGRRYGAVAARAHVEYAVPLWRRGGFLYRGDAFAAFGMFGLGSVDDLRWRDQSLRDAVPLDLTADLGVRLDTYVGIFTLSVANALGRIPF